MKIELVLSILLVMAGKSCAAAEQPKPTQAPSDTFASLKTTLKTHGQFRLLRNYWATKAISPVKCADNHSGPYAQEISVTRNRIDSFLKTHILAYDGCVDADLQQFIENKLTYTPTGIVAFSPIGVFAYTDGTDVIRICDKTNKAEILQFCPLRAPALGAHETREQLKRKNPVYALRFTPDGKTLAIGYMDSTILLLNVKTGNVRKSLHANSGVIHSFAFTAGKRLLASAFSECKTTLWDIKKMEIIRVISHSASSLEFSSDSKTLIAGSPGQQLQQF